MVLVIIAVFAAAVIVDVVVFVDCCFKSHHFLIPLFCCLEMTYTDGTTDDWTDRRTNQQTGGRTNVTSFRDVYVIAF